MAKHAAARLTVVMPVFNSGGLVREAIDSVLDQTFRDFVLLVVDDGSGDETAAILKSYSDPRLRVETNARTEGPSASLNRAFSGIRTDYIVRMDHDDVCLRDRLERQVGFMDRRPSVDVSGGAALLIEGGRPPEHRRPAARHEDIRMQLMFRCELTHPTVIFRRRSLESAGLLYPPREVTFADDYYLWVAGLGRWTYANMPDTVLLHRRREGSVTGSMEKERDRFEDGYRAVHALYFEKIGRPLDEGALRRHGDLCSSYPPRSRGDYRSLLAWACELGKNGGAEFGFDPPAFRALLLQNVLRKAGLAARYGGLDFGCTVAALSRLAGPAAPGRAAAGLARFLSRLPASSIYRRLGQPRLWRSPLGRRAAAARENLLRRRCGRPEGWNRT